jgi:DNA-binding CsgD family transcriptional regulator
MWELPTDRLVALGLTAHEADVVGWLAHGKSNIEIATILSISVQAVLTHVEPVSLKLGVEHRHAAVAGVHDALRRTASGRYPRRLHVCPSTDPFYYPQVSCMSR